MREYSMEQHHGSVNTATATTKKPYEAPKAVFVPLKIEERLLGCLKTNTETCDNGPSAS
jgi:hypothetical protein